MFEQKLKNCTINSWLRKLLLALFKINDVTVIWSFFYL